MAKKAFLITVFMLSGCTSSQVASSGCDFVVGSVQSQQRQAQHRSIDSSDTDLTVNIINGIFSMLMGPINRSIGSDECQEKEQTYAYPSHAVY